MGRNSDCGDRNIIISINKKIIFRVLGVILAIIICASLVILYRSSPESEPFKNNEILMPESWEISLNQTEEWETASLPADIYVQQGDSATIKTVLSEQVSDGAVLFFKSNHTSVSVAIDREEIYNTGYDGKLIGQVWHFIELPRDSASKTLTITQKQVLRVFYFPMTFLEVGIANNPAAIFEYFNRNHLFIFYASTVLFLISLVILFVALFDIRKNPQAKNLLYLSAMFILITIWSVSESPITHLYFSALYSHKPYLLTYISFTAGMLFTAPAMLYYGEYYGRRRLFETLSLITISVAVILCLIDLLFNYTIVEMFMVVLTVRSVNLAVILLFALLYSLPGKRKPKQSKLILASNIATCLMGIIEAFRLLVFHQQTISFLFYTGMAFFLFARVFETIVSYLNEREEYRLARMRNEEILRSVEIQQNHYRQLASQIDLNRRMNHDFKQFQTMLYGALQKDEPEKARELFEQIDNIYKNMKVQVYCDNMEIDALISYARENCKKHGVEFIHSIRLSDAIGSVKIYDLCIVIGNLLDNAIEAAAKCASRRVVEITAAVYNSNLVIKVENTYSGKLKTDGEVYITTKDKADRHGLGISIVKKIMETSGGDLSLKADKKLFTATAMWEI